MEGSEITHGQTEPLDGAVDHVRGAPAGRLIVEYGDDECPYSRQAFREIGLVERRLDGDLRFAFRHFPLTEIHPHALAASAAAEAAALQDRFWEMHELLFHRQKALEDDDLLRYAGELALDVEAFDRARGGSPVFARIRRDVESGIASGEVRRTPTLFIDGVVHRGRIRCGQPAGGTETMSQTCTHLDQIELTELPNAIPGCEDCLAIGGTWVHLRMCQSCGHIACCDSSPNRHASAHARDTEHPVARSAEPGEAWSWCYVDQVAFVIGAPDAA